jgi:hypothetical protein
VGALSNPGTYRHDDLEFARAVTFFDAIFAFAVTLLITTVDDFSAEAWSSFQALKDTNGPSLLAFAISFVVVVSFWRANHQEVTRFKALDGRIIAAFVFDHVATSQVSYPLNPDRRGDVYTAVFPTGEVDLATAGTWTATLNLDGIDVSKGEGSLAT